MNFVWKIDDRETESIAFLIFVLYQRFNRRWVKGGGVVQEAESIVFLKQIVLWWCFNRWWMRGGIVGLKVLFWVS